MAGSSDDAATSFLAAVQSRKLGRMRANLRWIYALYRLAMAGLVFTAIAVQYADVSDNPGFSPVNYFSFFTNQSNILAASIFVYGAYHAVARDRTAPGLDMLRGASVVYMAITFLVVQLLLKGMEEDLAVPLPWVNYVVHELMPFAVVVDWLLDPPDQRIGYRKALLWLAFPLVWLTYTLIRGGITEWFPYPFVNFDKHSWGHVISSCASVLAGFVVVAFVTAFVGNALRVRFRLPGAARSA